MPEPRTPLEIYRQRVSAGTLAPDPAQKQALKALERLYGELMEAHEAPRRNFFQKLTGLGQRKGEAPQGVYLYGGVGRGKSMAMDLFYACLPEDIRKRRVHFHEFMIEVHDYIHSRRDSEGIREGVDAALPALAERIAERSRILCFDEFHVTDVADAMILGRLFTALFGRDVAVVATSNWPPDRLYEGGLQRERFLPFIALMKDKMEIVHLTEGPDYRAQLLREEGTYFTPLGYAARTKADRLFAHLTGGAPARQEELEVRGRTIPVESASGGVARFSFAQLCERPHGAEDYLAIARRYHTVFLEGVPKLAYDRRNEAKRLMILIDALYENRVKLVVTADAPPERLYLGKDHAFEFERTVSRLREMGSAAYFAQ